MEDKITYIVRDLEAEKKIEAILAMPLKSQRIHYHSRMNTPYCQNRIVKETDEKISVYDRDISLRWSEKSGYWRQKLVTSGIYLNKKGTRASRLKIWGIKGSHTASYYPFIDVLASYLGKETNAVFRDKVVHRYMKSQGMISSALSGGINTLEEAVQYYMRYRLRCGLDMKQWRSVYAMSKQGIDCGNLIKIFTIAEDKGKLLDAISLTTDVKRFCNKFNVNDYSRSNLDILQAFNKTLPFHEESFTRFDCIRRVGKAEDKLANIRLLKDFWVRGPEILPGKYKQAPSTGPNKAAGGRPHVWVTPNHSKTISL
jgi:hypothetical protein